MTDPTDHQSLIAELGGAADVAAGVNTLAVNVRAWSSRNRIPAEYWPALIDFASSKAVDITADWLMRTTPARKRQEPAVAPAPQEEAA